MCGRRVNNDRSWVLPDQLAASRRQANQATPLICLYSSIYCTWHWTWKRSHESSLTQKYKVLPILKLCLHVQQAIPQIFVTKTPFVRRSRITPIFIYLFTRIPFLFLLFPVIQKLSGRQATVGLCTSMRRANTTSVGTMTFCILGITVHPNITIVVQNVR